MKTKPTETRVVHYLKISKHLQNKEFKNFDQELQEVLSKNPENKWLQSLQKSFPNMNESFNKVTFTTNAMSVELVNVADEFGDQIAKMFENK